MESNNIITAPQVKEVSRFFDKWKINHTGNLKAFYRFMITPSAERDEFIDSLGVQVHTDIVGSIAEITIKRLELIPGPLA